MAAAAAPRRGGGGGGAGGGGGGCQLLRDMRIVRHRGNKVKQQFSLQMQLEEEGFFKDVELKGKSAVRVLASHAWDFYKINSV